jgi:hypothetical protein
MTGPQEIPSFAKSFNLKCYFQQSDPESLNDPVLPKIALTGSDDGLMNGKSGSSSPLELFVQAVICKKLPLGCHCGPFPSVPLPNELTSTRHTLFRSNSHSHSNNSRITVMLVDCWIFISKKRDSWDKNSAVIVLGLEVLFLRKTNCGNIFEPLLFFSRF